MSGPISLGISLRILARSFMATWLLRSRSIFSCEEKLARMQALDVYAE
jgi:hypothetical protein